MPTWLLLALDGFFFVFHTVIVLFNTFGWMFRRLRRWNLLLQGLTFASWGILGIKYGFGYCVCTDLHWHVREALGIHDQAQSYIQLIVFKLSGWMPPIDLTTQVTGVVFGASVLASLVANARDLKPILAAKRDNANLSSSS